jgi:hypothetical protein
MPGLHTVPGREDVGQVGAHAPVDPQGPPDPSLDAGGHTQLGVGANPDHDQDQVGGDSEVGFAGHGQPASVVVDGFDSDVVDHLDVVATQLLAQQPPQLKVDGGMTAGACSTTVTSRPRAQKASAISSPM